MAFKLYYNSSARLIARPDDPEVYKGYGAIFALTGILN